MNQAEQARRLEALRVQIQGRELAAYIVPKSDEYMLEYAPPCSERLAWVSGFTGSAGVAIVARDKAALFVDGRYTVQAERQTSAALWEHQHLTEAPPAAWLAQLLREGDRVGYDPHIHTPQSLESMRAAVIKAGAELAPVEGNLVDAVWADRPPEPAAPVELYPEQLAGESSASKRSRMARALEAEGQQALVVSAPDSLMWLLN